MAGYSDTPLARKLGVREGQVLFLDRPRRAATPDTEPDAGPDIEPALVAAGAHVVRRLPRRADLVLTFHTQRGTLEKRLPILLEHTATDGAIWVCWPKRSAQRSARNPDGPVSDLDENLVRATALAAGVVDVKVAAVDEVWSGLKLVRRRADR